MHDVFHVMSGYVFHVFDCMIVCYTLHGKRLQIARKDIHGMMYMGNVIAWLLSGKILCMA